MTLFQNILSINMTYYIIVINELKKRFCGIAFYLNFFDKYYQYVTE